MGSASLRRWSSDRVAKLDQIESAHRAVRDGARGRRWATEQINHAYAVLLSSQFQRFCRDLHSECIDHIVSAVSPAIIRSVLRLEFNRQRRLDVGNPNPGNLGSDFDRLGVSFWGAVRAEDARNARRHQMLEHLNGWRNAIAHQDFDPSKLTPATLNLATLERWRSGLDALAVSFDRVMSSHLSPVLGSPPW